jgi:hypothetical protein
VSGSRTNLSPCNGLDKYKITIHYYTSQFYFNKEPNLEYAQVISAGGWRKEVQELIQGFY